MSVSSVRPTCVVLSTATDETRRNEARSGAPRADRSHYGDSGADCKKVPALEGADRALREPPEATGMLDGGRDGGAKEAKTKRLRPQTTRRPSEAFARSGGHEQVVMAPPPEERARRAAAAIAWDRGSAGSV